MKKIFTSLCSILLCGMLSAQSYEVIFWSLPTISNEQLIHYDANEAAIEAARTQCKKALEQADAVSMRQGAEFQKAQQRLEKSMEQNQPNQAQMQASMTVAGDMMKALQEAGITPEQMEKMSEEELAAILMPTIAQKTGLSEEELKKMQSMSDKQAEAYMKQGNRAQRVQSSEYGQYGDVMKDMKPALDITDADYEKIDLIDGLREQLENMDALDRLRTTMMSQSRFEFDDASRDLYAADYEPRIQAILDKLYARIEQEPAWKTSKGNGIPMPVYGNEFYSNANQLIDEYNREVVTRFENIVGNDMAAIKAALLDGFAICREQEKVYNTLTTEDAKAMAMKHMSQYKVYSLLRDYISVLQLRLNLNHVNHLEMPKVVGGMG